MLTRFDLRAWVAAHPEVKGKPPKITPQMGRCCVPQTPAEATRAFRRASGWIRRIPGAVAGQNGHGRTLFVAVILLRGFLLTRPEARSLLDEWNKSCVPPWDDRELEHKLDSAQEAACREMDGWMLKTSYSTCDNISIF